MLTKNRIGELFHLNRTRKEKKRVRKKERELHKGNMMDPFFGHLRRGRYIVACIAAARNLMLLKCCIAAKLVTAPAAAFGIPHTVLCLLTVTVCLVRPLKTEIVIEPKIPGPSYWAATQLTSVHAQPAAVVSPASFVFSKPVVKIIIQSTIYMSWCGLAVLNNDR